MKKLLVVAAAAAGTLLFWRRRQAAAADAALWHEAVSTAEPPRDTDASRATGASSGT